MLREAERLDAEHHTRRIAAMTALVASVFLASLVGGLHCVGMCGGLMAFAVQPRPGQARATGLWARLWGGQTPYHVGRFVGYASLGAAAGAVGSLLNLGGTLVGLSHVALAVAAVLMIGFGISILVTTLAQRPMKALKCGGFVAEPLAKLASRVQLQAFRLPPTRRALLIGLATPLLPCGWLYAFAATAAGTGSVLGGAAVMSAFWAGTVPAMAGLGVGLRALFGTAGKRLPLVTATLLILVGAWTLWSRAGLDASALAARAAAGQMMDHDDPAPAVPSSDELPPCCQPGADEGHAATASLRESD